jgi:uncharacterized protein YbjT (DUF2867 family)
MCVSDGCPHMVLLSSTRAPWVSRPYIRAKREAEAYIERVGLRATIIRAPVAYMRGQRRHLFFMLMTMLGSIPPTSWFVFGRIAPMPIDMLARGVARITLEKKPAKTIYYARDLRARSTPQEARRAAPNLTTEEMLRRREVKPFELLDENTPFGWSPPEDDE